MLVSSRCDVKGNSTIMASCVTPWRLTAILSGPLSRVYSPLPKPWHADFLTLWKEKFSMKNLGIWLYRYIAIHMGYTLHHVSARLDAMAPSPVSKPALQRVRTPVSPSVNDIRLRSDFLTPW